MTPDGKTLFGRMPAVADREDNFALSAHLSPNLQVIARCDNVHPIVIWPLTPTKTRVYVYNLYPVEFFALPDFHERAMVYDRYMDLVLNEDGEMMISLQRAMSSRNYVPGRLSTLENGVHHVLTTHLSKLGSGVRQTPQP
jgi:phenylpropionate dioxygenase-like ring-hydroxylating dioxygenase large terminal subunit